MNQHRPREMEIDLEDLAPGSVKDDRQFPRVAIASYVAGLVLSVLLTAASFLLPHMGLVWPPAVTSALMALAVGQIGVHLVFFLHITTDPDNTNNILALAFGILVVGLIVIGSLWIMAHLNHNMMPMAEVMKMQR